MKNFSMIYILLYCFEYYGTAYCFWKSTYEESLELFIKNCIYNYINKSILIFVVLLGFLFYYQSTLPDMEHCVFGSV
jgi:hypothetical protein